MSRRASDAWHETHAQRVLDAQPEGPPSPVDLERLAIAHVWDGKFEVAKAIVDRMLDTYVGRDDHGRFQWWLGFGYAVDGVVGHAMGERDRRDRRAARRSR